MVRLTHRPSYSLGKSLQYPNSRSGTFGLRINVLHFQHKLSSRQFLSRPVRSLVTTLTELSDCTLYFNLRKEMSTNHLKFIFKLPKDLGTRRYMQTAVPKCSAQIIVLINVNTYERKPLGQQTHSMALWYFPVDT